MSYIYVFAAGLVAGILGTLAVIKNNKNRAAALIPKL